MMSCVIIKEANQVVTEDFEVFQLMNNLGILLPAYSRGFVSAKDTLYRRQSICTMLTLSIFRTQGQHWPFSPAGQGKHKSRQISTPPPIQFVLTDGGSSSAASCCLRATQVYCDVHLSEQRSSWWELDKNKTMTFNPLPGKGSKISAGAGYF